MNHFISKTIRYYHPYLPTHTLRKAEEPGEFRGGDPEEMRLKKEEKQTELGESGDAGEDQGGEEPDPADVEEAQQADQDKSEGKSVSIGKAITTAMGAVEASPWPPNTTDYPSKDRNGNPVHDNVDFHFRGVKQPWIEVGPPRQGPNQKKPWSEVLGLPPLMAPSGPPYWRQKLLQERRDELGMSPRPRLIEPTDMYAMQSVAKAFDDLLEKAKATLGGESAEHHPYIPGYKDKIKTPVSLNVDSLDHVPEHINKHVSKIVGPHWKDHIHRYVKEVNSGEGLSFTPSPVLRAMEDWMGGGGKFPHKRGAGQAIVSNDVKALNHLTQRAGHAGWHRSGVVAGVLSRMPLNHEAIKHQTGGSIPTHLYRGSMYVPHAAKVGDVFHLSPSSFSSGKLVEPFKDYPGLMKMRLPSRGFSLGNHSLWPEREVLVSGHYRIHNISYPRGRTMFHVEEIPHGEVNKAIENQSQHEMNQFIASHPSEMVSAKGAEDIEHVGRGLGKRMAPCPYGGGIECLRHGGDGADAHYPSFHHKHEDQSLSHEDVLHQEAGKDPGERTHSLNQMQKKALVGHVMSRYESEGTDLDNPDTRSKYMKTLRHIHGYLGKDAESNAWRKKAISEWKSKISQYHGSEDQKPEGHLAMEAAEKQIDVTCDFSREVGWGSTDSKESDLPEKMLEQAFGRQMRISDFERAYTVDDDNLKLPTPDGGYGANIHHINIVEKEQGQYEINVMGSIDYSYGEGSERAATFVRVIHCSVGGKKKQDRFIMVHHDKIFVLDADHSKVGGHQNSGLSTDFLKHSVIEYQKWGVNQITTSPHWVGKYTWARMGFQWNEEAAATVGRHMTKFLISHYGMEKKAAAKLAAKFADMPSRFAVKTLSNPQLTEDGQALFRSFEKSEYRCKPEEVGKAFLLSDGGNQVWMNGGMVDMSRKTSPSYRQLRKYLGLK